MDRSGPAAPEPAIAPRHHAEAGFVTRQRRVFRELEFLFDRVPALAVLGRFLDLGGCLLHQREHGPGVVLGAEPVVRLARMAWDHAIPIELYHFVDEGLG